MNAARIAAKALLSAADLFRPKLRGPRIMIYHQVGSGRTHEMNVETSAFRQQIRWMQAHGEIVSLEEAVKRRGEPNSHRLFVLTFDDGYVDVFSNAFPLLAEHELPFTLYLTSGPIEQPDEFLEWPGIPLAWSQVRTMISSGLATIGAHTHSHPDLRQLSLNAVAEELDRSNSLISDRTETWPKHFAYPKGWWASDAHTQVQKRYSTATLGGGASITAHSDPLLLNRLPIQRSDLGFLFDTKVWAGGITEESLRRRLDRYLGP